MKPFRVKVVLAQGAPKLYEFPSREEAFAFASAMFGDDMYDVGVKYVVLAPKEATC